MVFGEINCRRKEIFIIIIIIIVIIIIIIIVIIIIIIISLVSVNMYVCMYLDIVYVCICVCVCMYVRKPKTTYLPTFIFSVFFFVYSQCVFLCYFFSYVLHLIFIGFSFV